PGQPPRISDRRAPPDRAAPSVIRGAPACPSSTAPATVPAARRSTPSVGPTTLRKAMPEFETLGYEESGGVAWVTLNRPDVMNAFNTTMQRELRDVWRWLRRHDEVRVVVLTGAGEKACCTGIDRSEPSAEGPRPARAGSAAGATGPHGTDDGVHIGSGTTPF